jgi:hydroxyisourate hydrolase
VTGTSVTTHVLDTAAGRPAAGVPVELSVLTPDGSWAVHATATTDGDGRCRDLPALPEEAARVRLRFAVGGYLDARPPAGERSPDGAFFPEVVVTLALRPGEHHHVPLLLSPFGYSVYRGS